MSKWIKKGDKVVAIAGNEKGKTGTVLARKEDRVVVEGLNVRKKHLKPRTKMSSGIVEMEAPMHISNVSLCNDEGKPVKVAVKITDDGNKQLVYKQGKKEVIYRDVKKKS